MPRARNIQAEQPRWRAGTVYVAVLGVSLLVTMIGLGGMAANSAIGRTYSAAADSSRARWTARSAMELACEMIDLDPLWRTTHSNGAWVTNQPLGKASYSITVKNPTGDLNRDDLDTVVVTVVGKFGNAVHSIEADLVADTTTPSCMSCAAAVNGAITFNGTSVTSVEGIIACNSAVTAVLANVNAKVEASLTVLGLTFTQSTTGLCAARAMPGTTAFNSYLTLGTKIPITSLPSSSGARQLNRVLLSPSSNPFSGGTNSQGVYIIDCAGQDLTIMDSRIVGTLVVINPTSNFVVKGSMAWEPAVANYPCLMVQGNAQIRTSSSAISEGSGGTNINFNPSGTPFPYFSGISNSNTDDSLPSAIEGLIYVSGDLVTSGTLTARMLLVGGAWTSSGTAVLNYDSTMTLSPPPGFGSIKMRPQIGSVRQVTQ